MTDPGRALGHDRPERQRQPGRCRSNRWARDLRAQVGIGTMIVFIATILVAATATAVMIDTAGQLEQKSRLTGEESTRAISSTIYVKGVYGARFTTAQTDLKTLNITISLAPGSEPIDVSQLSIRMSNGATVTELAYSASNAGAGYYVVSVPRDEDASFSAANPILTDSDLANLQINLTNQGMSLPTRTDMDIALVPHAGVTIRAGFMTPASYGIKTIIILR